MKTLINNIEQEMLGILNNEQLEMLHITLEKNLRNVVISDNPNNTLSYRNDMLLKAFLSAKQVEGCSDRTIMYYRSSLERMLNTISKSARQVDTDDIRTYLSDYENKGTVGKVTIDNIRRIISSFFSWLEDENYIIKSPARRIHKIRVGNSVKEVFSDEDLEKMRDACSNYRDLAMIDLLSSTGIRVGELVKLNIRDINFDSRECVVLGKGNKERKVYFDARTKIHLFQYIESRTDNNMALFVSLTEPYSRLSIRGIETRLCKIGENLAAIKIHPHKFRRSFATKAIDKGMPIEQVQVLLGHSQIDTTLRYAMVNQNNVKISHQKYMG